jgi:hypothetical protein
MTIHGISPTRGLSRPRRCPGPAQSRLLRIRPAVSILDAVTRLRRGSDDLAPFVGPKQTYARSRPTGHPQQTSEGLIAVSTGLCLWTWRRGGSNDRVSRSLSDGYTTATAWRGWRRSVGPLRAVLGANDHRSCVARWPRYPADHHCLPAEMADDPAADPSAVSTPNETDSAAATICERESALTALLPPSMRYGGPSSKVRAACISAVAKPSVNRS